ncbi:MAG: hydrogenase iron-sulfur subunit [Desulfobacula sp.]|nr:hydrogenase iron-sulfur subunit [Desulfobacula sp.]
MDGNYYARRKFALMGNLLEHMGIEKDRVHFSWISSAEATKFVDVVKEISDRVKALGPNKKFVKDYN